MPPCSRLRGPGYGPRSPRARRSERRSLSMRVPSDIPGLHVELPDDPAVANVEDRVRDDAAAVVEGAGERARHTLVTLHRVVNRDLHAGPAAVLEDLAQLVLA